MDDFDEAAVLSRGKALAAQDGFTWELDFARPSAERAPLRGRHFLSEDRRQDYLERAREELRREAGGAAATPGLSRG
jgi:hypothetical protein